MKIPPAVFTNCPIPQNSSCVVSFRSVGAATVLILSGDADEHFALCTLHRALCRDADELLFNSFLWRLLSPSWYPPSLPWPQGDEIIAVKHFMLASHYYRGGRERANTKIDDEPKNYLVNWPTLFVLQISSLCYDGAPLAAVHPLIEYQLTFLAIKIKMRHCFAFDFSIFQLMVVFHCWPKYAHILD